jgi:hypothetical protein
MIRSQVRAIIFYVEGEGSLRRQRGGLPAHDTCRQLTTNITTSIRSNSGAR